MLALFQTLKTVRTMLFLSVALFHLAVDVGFYFFTTFTHHHYFHTVYPLSCRFTFHLFGIVPTGKLNIIGGMLADAHHR